MRLEHLVWLVSQSSADHAAVWQAMSFNSTVIPPAIKLRTAMEALQREGLPFLDSFSSIERMKATFELQPLLIHYAILPLRKFLGVEAPPVRRQEETSN